MINVQAAHRAGGRGRHLHGYCGATLWHCCDRRRDAIRLCLQNIRLDIAISCQSRCSGPVVHSGVDGDDRAGPGVILSVVLVVNGAVHALEIRDGSGNSPSRASDITTNQ